MSVYPFPISTSLSLAACACCLLSLQSDGTAVFPTAAYAHFSSHLLTSFFSLLSSLLPSSLFSVLPVTGKQQLPFPLPSSEPASYSLCTSYPLLSCFSINRFLLPSSQLSIRCCLNLSYLFFHHLSWSHNEVSFLFVLPHFHSITTARLPLGFVPLNLSYFLRLIWFSYVYVYVSI